VITITHKQLPSKGLQEKKQRSIKDIHLPEVVSVTEIQGLIKIASTEFTVSKLKHLQITLSHLQRTILYIVCSNSSNPSNFQCMYGKPVLEWPAAAMSYSAVSL
jgi:hypothetical protein